MGNGGNVGNTGNVSNTGNIGNVGNTGNVYNTGKYKLKHHILVLYDKIQHSGVVLWQIQHSASPCAVFST